MTGKIALGRNRGALMQTAKLRFWLGTKRQEFAGERERRRRIAFYRQFLERGDLCFDVGANIGSRSRLFLRIGARVVAVEPQADCQAKLAPLTANPQFTLVSEAVGAAEGEMPLLKPSSGSALASMSRDWIERVQASGRFSAQDWALEETVPVTTLDRLIETHGLPRFCKIDVEGYEDEVLRGLSRSIPALSIEFTQEFLDGTARCLELIAALGDYEFNYSLEESFVLAERTWLQAGPLLGALESLGGGSHFGDVYARLA
jgi:FkbM family methyltransferase